MAKNRKTLGLAMSEPSWETQRDLDTLIECEKIEADPKRLKAAQALAKQRMLDNAKVATDSEA